MTDNPCQERAGFLFKHTCHESARQNCDRCGKHICGLHAQMVGGGKEWCITCAKTYAANATPESAELRPTEHDRRSPAAGKKPPNDTGHHHDTAPASPPSHATPYYYGSTHYSGFGYYALGYWGSSHLIGSNNSTDAGIQSTAFDNNDFTDGDSAALGEAGDEGFERELDAS